MLQVIPLFFQQLRKLPEVAVKNRVAARDVKIRRSAKFTAHILAAFNHLFHLLPRHFGKFFAIILSENVTVLAPLVAVVCNMPLKSKIRFHYNSCLCKRISGFLIYRHTEPIRLLCEV